MEKIFKKEDLDFYVENILEYKEHFGYTYYEYGNSIIFIVYKNEDKTLTGNHSRMFDEIYDSLKIRDRINKIDNLPLD
jgi:hypothetical protein